MILNETSYFGKGAIQEIVPEIKKRGFKKVLLVTDKQLATSDVVGSIKELLTTATINFEVYSGIVPNPSIEDVQNGVEFAKKMQADCILAVGGGSPIDTAKAIGIIVTNPEFADVRSLEGVADTKKPCLPILAVPTTAGTAAEVTINYVITDKEKNRKFVCADPHDIPVVSFVDSDLMMGMPKALCAATGMDALTHAVEGLITQGAWEMTDMLHLKAIEIITRSLKDSVEGNQTAREEMALGQYIAGMGFSNVGLGLVHGMAHPLSAWYDIPHGVACASLLPTVLDFNKDFTGEKYREMAKVMGIENAETLSLSDVREKVVTAIDTLGQAVGIPRTISELGVKQEDLEEIAKDAINDVCSPGNPREASLEQVIALYESLM
ncbi:lactaldehyde reductase [Vagococcus sp.]|uniref:lactaldehyde reductase n=1 Tax=Vagococcus sp. TaxID=1933889 RepID=UPI003F9981FF